jgi:uncharacterized MAPEG superfamily protein
MTELTWLLIAVVLGLVHLGIASQMAQKYRTPAWGFGPRDEPLPSQGVAARMERAFRNFMETFPFFAVAVLAVVIQNKVGALAWWGACLYVIARIVYVPIYAAGVPYIRTLLWFIGVVGTILVLIAAFR